ncbi:hypothetical protein CPB86DRAFT_814709 [Serendipita vermifera]|nr:hypothetical protein CPB86DRAFT_814709 [Serendipita vermifera]
MELKSDQYGGTGLYRNPKPESAEHSLLSRIYGCNEAIDRLESQLLACRQLKADLERQLLETRSITSPIKLLTEDIIILIFQKLVDANPIDIGRVLQVCQAWYSVATKRPILWTRIITRPGRDVESIHRMTRYVEAAVSYSQGLPLDIVLDFFEVGYFWEGVASLLTYDKDYSDYVSFMTWVEEQPQYFARCPLLRKYATAAAEHMQVVVGQNGCHVRRWRSICIKFVSSQMGLNLAWVDLLAKLGHESPQLESIVLVDGDIDPISRLSRRIFTHTPKLKSIVWDCSFNLQDCGSHWQNIEILDLHRINGPENLHTASLFYNLKRLFLSFKQSSNATETTPVTRFKFSQLRDLTISGPIPKEVKVGLNAPVLRILRLVDEESVYSVVTNTPRFPMLRSVHLYATAKPVMEAARLMMSCSPSLEELGIIHEDEAEVRQVIMKC